VKWTVRFSLRSLLLLIALVCLNLSGGIATFSYPRIQSEPPGVHLHGNGTTFTEIHPDGTVIRAIERSTSPRGKRAGLKNGYRDARFRAIDRSPPGSEIFRLEKRPPPLTTIQRWAPVMASLALTVLATVFVVPPHTPRTMADPQPSAIRPPGSGLTACLTLRRPIAVAALVLLNYAAAIYRGPDRPTDPWLRQNDHLPGGVMAMGATGPDGVVEVHHVSPYSLPTFIGNDHAGILRTIVYNLDGSVVGYQGVPGSAQSGPYLIQPATRSFLDMWWPALGSVSITVAVGLCMVVGCLRETLGLASRRSDPNILARKDF
jgi:hypothetical protein